MGDAAKQREARKEMQRVERKLARAAARIEELEAALADLATGTDYERMTDTGNELAAAREEHSELELAWLEAAEAAGE